MGIKQKYHKCNNVIVKYSKLIKSDFDVSSVWVEHNTPNELEDIKNHKVTNEWIEQYFYNEIKDDSHPYYAIIGNSEYYKHSEFVFVGCLVSINNLLFHGYVTIFDQYLTSLKIFHRSKIFSFYLNDLFNNENQLFKSKLEAITSGTIKNICINLKSEFQGLKNIEKNLVVDNDKNVLIISF